MSFSPKELSVLAYANGFTLWHYRTADAASAVDTNGYFNMAGEVFRAGDMILANTGLANSPAAGLFLVRNAQANLVDVSDLLAVGATNSD
jgi:hypothetical protein